MFQGSTNTHNIQSTTAPTGFPNLTGTVGSTGIAGTVNMMSATNTAIAPASTGAFQAGSVSSMSSTVFGPGNSMSGESASLPSYTWGAPSKKTVSHYQPLQIQSTPAESRSADGSSKASTGVASVLGLEQLPSVGDQLQRLKNAWDPTHPDCAFQYYFYNRVPIDEVALYVKPAHHSQQKWDKAIANRPENSVVPALAVGFSDIQKRVQLQEQQVAAYRVRMHEIVNKLKELSQKHDLSTTVKISEATLRHLELARRSLALAAKIQILKGRGYALQTDEENLKQRLKELSKKINDPGVFGKVNELWARMTFVRDKAQSVEEARQHGIVMSIDWKKDHEQLYKITKVLSDQQAGISYVIHLLKGDLHEVDKVLEKIEERKKRLERPK